ncbi:hypothetical protein O181_016286 [Austropuccinia psidii MF-1]|uniref:Uncharacterized protein n=1 Tax=Austropuccinia psidii MF-1 TaxID=1389203 RepID=A0A9Q3C5B6_9BASI|nr:hypothetical protein [Austropuccinia psidii MF-1]
MPVMLANKHTKNACLLHAQRSSLVRTPSYSKMMKELLSTNGPWEHFCTIGPVPSGINLSTPLLDHHLMVTSLLDQRKAIIWPMKNGHGERTFKLGLIIIMPCHPWDSNSKNKTHQIPLDNTLPFPICLESKLCGNQIQAQVAPHVRELTLPPFLEPSQHNEPPIPGPSEVPASKVPLTENDSTCEPEPEVALMHSMEDPFAFPATPHSFIIIENLPVGPPQHKEPLIPTIKLCRNLLTCDQCSLFLKQ